MEKSLNFNLGLPEGKDKIDVSVLSSNFRVIDRLLNELVTGNPFVQGGNVKVELTDFNYYTGSENFENTINFSSNLPAIENGNYYKGVLGCNLQLYLDDKIELSGDYLEPFYVYPAGKDGVLADCSRTGLSIYLAYNVISRQLFFEALKIASADMDKITNDGNTLRIRVGTISVEVIEGCLSINYDTSVLFGPEDAGSVFIPGIISEEEEEN